MGDVGKEAILGLIRESQPPVPSSQTLISKDSPPGSCRLINLCLNITPYEMDRLSSGALRDKPHCLVLVLARPALADNVSHHSQTPWESNSAVSDPPQCLGPVPSHRGSVPPTPSPPRPPSRVCPRCLGVRAGATEFHGEGNLVVTMLSLPSCLQ